MKINLNESIVLVFIFIIISVIGDVVFINQYAVWKYISINLWEGGLFLTGIIFSKVFVK